MNKSNLFLLLCICHVIGDYYLQGEKTAEEKKDSMSAYIRHCVSYAIPYLIWAILEYVICGTAGGVYVFLTCALLHATVDFLKIRLEKIFGREIWRKRVKNPKAVLYSTDQIAHISCLLVLTIIYQGQLPVLPQRVLIAIPYVLYLLCLLKPANITFRVLFSRFQIKVLDEAETQTEGESEMEPKAKPGAGAWIGSLERLLSGVFILLGQFSAVGLTMTAKSIARYEKITKNPPFAEYYLIGTLYSILYTVALYCLIFRFIL